MQKSEQEVDNTGRCSNARPVVCGLILLPHLLNRFLMRQRRLENPLVSLRGARVVEVDTVVGGSVDVRGGLF